jgi:hypothetical protein
MVCAPLFCAMHVTLCYVYRDDPLTSRMAVYT